jgi:peptidoglycan/LPS O-acetylase OafA/YrhL
MVAYRSEIDGLRAIAIVSVVLFHAGGTAFTGGYVGVDIFFVISGFLITSLILDAEASAGFSYRDFYARRARRILPALFFMAAAVTAISFAILLPADLVEYGKLLIYTILFGANFRLTATPGYFDTSSQENPLLHMWSLSVEEQFYLLWPTLLLALVGLLPARRAKVAGLLLAFASLMCAEILVHSWPKSAFFHLPSRGWELITGALLAMRIAPKLSRKGLAEALPAAGLALMLVPVFLYGQETAFPGLSALPPVIGCALVIHSESSFRTRVGALLSLKPIVFIGLISYSLYLWHWPVFALTSYVLMRPLTLAETVICIAAAVLLAALSWRFVERPFRKPLDPSAAVPLQRASGLPRLPRAAYAATALAACLVASGSFFQETKGAAWRLPSRVTSIALTKDKADFLACTSEKALRDNFIECKTGNPDETAKTDAVLWGDSHAMHYQRLVAASYGKLTAYLSNGCPPILNVYLVYTAIQAVDVACEEKKEYAFKKILELHPKVAILAGRWTFSEPLNYGLDKSKSRFFIMQENEERSIAHSRRVFELGLANTVERLTKAGVKVVLMGQPPELLAPLSRCLAMSHYFYRDESSCLALPRAEAERRQSNVNRVLRSIAAADPSVAVFWPMPHMCDSEACYAIRNGKMLYRDNSHLSPAGSLALAEAFQSSLPPAFVGRDPARTAASE